MLAATDPVANPAAAGVTEPEPSDAQGAENGGAEAMVTSEHMLARMDGLLSRGEDRPTPLFYAGVAAFVPLGGSGSSSARSALPASQTRRRTATC